MKKVFALLLTAALTASLLCGCGASKEPEPEAEETPAVATTAAPAATQAAVLENGMVSPHWFDDAVFVGDSISTTLDYFCADDPELLGDAMFVCADSLSYHNAQWDLNDPNAVHPTYRGETVLAETAAEITGANKMFILMGINDLDNDFGVEDSMDTVRTFTEKILSHSPNVQLYFQSTTPMIPAKETDIVNNALITEFDGQLEAYCRENGYHYLDVYHQMCDETGALKAEYCDDPDDDGIHFNYQGCIAWVNYLKSAVAG